MNKLLILALALAGTSSVTAGVCVASVKANNQEENPVYLEFPEYLNGGSGHEDDPFLIRSSKDWDTFVSRLTSSIDDNPTQRGVYYKLEEDIRVYKQAGNHTKSLQFAGVFDGNGHSITYYESSKKDTCGLFGSNSGIIKNLTTYGYISGNSNVASICAYNYGLIDNCTNYMTITGSKQYIGGIVAINGSDSQVGYVKNCTNYGDISSTSLTSLYKANGTCVGGILGFGYDYGDTIIESCYNYGNVFGISMLGGIVGQCKKNPSSTNLGIYKCKNYGDVKYNTETEEISYAGHIGGIVGYLGDGVNVKECSSSGTVVGYSGRNDSYWRGVGGIVGSFYKSNIADCLSFSDVSSYYMSGGIVGYCEKTYSKTIENCLATGKIHADLENAGGIIGRTNGVAVNNNIGATTIDCGKDSGPIIGKVGSSVTQTGNLVYSLSLNGKELFKIIGMFDYNQTYTSSEASNLMSLISDLKNNLSGNNDLDLLNSTFPLNKLNTYEDELDDIIAHLKTFEEEE